MITGDLDGSSTLRECGILDLNYFNGFLFQCGVSGTITLLGTATAVFLQCYSRRTEAEVPTDYPTIDLGGTQNTPLVVRGWVGALRITNCSLQNENTSIDINSGRVYLDPTLTDGTYTIRGIAEVIDASGPGTVVEDLTLATTIPDAVWTEDMAEHIGSAGTSGRYLLDAGKAANAIVLDTFTVQSGSTDIVVRTDATQDDAFYNNMLLVVVNAAGSAARPISNYANADGAFTVLKPFPFVPDITDIVLVLASDPEAPVVAAKASLIPALL